MFPCKVCGRKTRDTGAQSVENKICPQCYELAGIENDISDGHTSMLAARPQIEALIGEIIAKGGNVAEWINTFAASRS